MFQRYILLLLFSLFMGSFLFSLEKEGLDMALVFSFSALELEEYNGGAGFKVAKGPYALRAGASLAMDEDNEADGTEDSRWGINGVVEWHLNEEQLSPYVGMGLSWNGGKERTEIDSDNWTEDVENVLVIGPVFGGELQLLPHLSFFAEYQIAWEHTWEKVRTSVDGDVDESDSLYDWRVNIGLGNQAMLGFLLYF